MRIIFFYLRFIPFSSFYHCFQFFNLREQISINQENAYGKVINDERAQKKGKVNTEGKVAVVNCFHLLDL